MVKRRYKKKYLAESSDESDSDDFYEETPSCEAQTKKYSLRARRGTNLAEDFDYDVMNENETNNLAATEILRSDDEDYEQEMPIKKSSAAGKNKLNQEKPVITNCTVRKYREIEILPELSKSIQSSNKMIDFEDVIRADILVNQSKIDYDSVIEKSEIKLEKREAQPIESNGKSAKKIRNKEPPKKRGRKPKKPLPNDEESYENNYENNNQDSTGLPINTVLGVTESLYELAERYHLQREMLENEVASVPLEPIISENNSPGYTKIAFSESNYEVPMKQSNPESGSIEV